VEVIIGMVAIVPPALDDGLCPFPGRMADVTRGTLAESKLDGGHMPKRILLSAGVAAFTLFGCNRAEVQHANNICGCFETALAADATEMRAAMTDCNQQSRAIKEQYTDNPEGTEAIKDATEACMKPLHAKMATMSQSAKQDATMPRTAVKKRRKNRKTGGEK
jgi:hypothetical protein